MLDIGFSAFGVSFMVVSYRIYDQLAFFGLFTFWNLLNYLLQDLSGVVICSMQVLSPLSLYRW